MTVHTYPSQRDLADAMPLVSASATVNAVEELDRDRSDEVLDRLSTLAGRHGLPVEGIEAGTPDWPSMYEAAADLDPLVLGQLGALHDRLDRPHPSLVRLAFETDEPLDFVAGQFVTVRFRGRSRPYSLANSPTEDDAEVCVRRVPEGRLSPVLCEDLAVGDRLTVRGPNGHLHLEDPSPRDVAFFATGTGIAPLKSMIEYLFETGRDEYRGEPRDVWLFLGAAWADDLPYHAAFEALHREREHFHYVPCLSREPWLADWTGETEYVQDAVMKYVDRASLDDAAFGRHLARYLRQEPAVDVPARIDPHNVEVYACGLNGMVFGLETTAKRLGVPDRFIHGEGYG